MKKRKVTYEIVREFLDYYPGTGILIWKYRDRKWFKSNGSWKTWNIYKVRRKDRVHRALPALRPISILSEN